jgi:peptidoglycan/LPS O-acetylase OafA/YrhL
MGLEGIRGIAAIMVALSHIFFVNLLTPAFAMPPWLRTFEGGHAGVLTFFVLSGYVIGWTNPGPFSREAGRTYVWRRFVRLAPIYYVAMLVTVVVFQFTGIPHSPKVIFASLLGLQNYNDYFGLNLDPPQINGALWSLNYELLYYGLFLALWRFKPRSVWVFGPALIASALGWFAPRMMPLFISSYASGWLFWSTGWWISKQPLAEDADKFPRHIATWVLLILASYEISGITRVFNVFGWYSLDSGMVAICDLALLPAIILAIADVTRRKLPCRGLLVLLAWTVCIVPALGMVWTRRLWSHPEWVTGCAATLLAAVLLPVRSTKWLGPFAWFGGISYAFYVVHFPLMFFVQYLPFPKSTAVGFLERLPIWIALAVGLAWILERRFQPWMKGYLMRPRTVTN